MKKYIIEGNVITNISAEIEANSDKEAMKKFYELRDSFSADINDYEVEGCEGIVGDNFYGNITYFKEMEE